ncbi:alpha-glucoside-specific PTS transporter subunit IIBC [Pediococcus acidilactici]|uniref:alpha-glucoside-specific PTS transporter subunit IIBC n=1 Tax=Pediococcus acidilactici TaxID=1254 RepID=UPI0019502E28|nr:alpha-glucoside-specific PTS transporter subunit IIBC [Pediococcus acidilactici]MBM6585016.1 PTS transporter subunit EIIC [Pediococcus acidilactici]
MMEKFQRFGGAMLTPVLLFSTAGMILALSVVFTNPMLVGSIATKGTIWYNCWFIVESGGWTVFNQMELLFVVGLPLGLAKKSNGRAAMEALVIYLTCNYFINSMLDTFKHFFGVDFTGPVGNGTGLKMIAGIKTLDTGVLGAIVISGIAVWLHNRFFEKKLPEFLGVFQGSTLVVLVGFIVMLPFALIICLVWPKIQMVMGSMQSMLASSGVLGVWLFSFLERILIPTGLHHFIYTPFTYGPAVVEGGIAKYWMVHLNEFANSMKPMKELFPGGGFSLQGDSKVFAPVGISAAFYTTAKPESRKKVLALLIPVTLTAVVVGITEPLEFTFLFISPPLFAVHAFLAATMAASMYAFGVVGDFGGGLIDFVAKDWIPLFANHKSMIFTQISIGLIFTVIYFVVFRALILKFNIATPGREKEDKDIKLYSKKDYKEKQKNNKLANGNGEGNQFTPQAELYLEAFGGADNILEVNNCMTRLRVTVRDPDVVAENDAFISSGAKGVVRKGAAFQVIIGLDVPMVRDQFEKLVNKNQSQDLVLDKGAEQNG